LNSANGPIGWFYVPLTGPERYSSATFQGHVLTFCFLTDLLLSCSGV